VWEEVGEVWGWKEYRWRRRRSSGLVRKIDWAAKWSRLELY